MTKKSLLLLIIFAYAILCQGQPLLTAASTNLIVGDSYITYSSSPTGTLAGSAGAGVTWDYSMLNTTSADTTYYIGCDSTSYCYMIPGSNIVVENNSNYVLNYYNASADSLVETGIYDGFSPIVYTDPKVLLRYPLHTKIL
jgi:hypothetical protein